VLFYAESVGEVTSGHVTKIKLVAEFLSNCRQVVYAGKTESDYMTLQFSVPQESVLSQCVFVQYAEDVNDIFQRHGVHHHLFADDMQAHCSGQLHDIPEIVSRLESCIINTYAWCGAKRLQLNANKKELLWLVQHRSRVSCHLTTIASTSTSAS